MSAMLNNNMNVVRLSRGQDRVQFEISRGCRWAWMKNSKGEQHQIHLDEARERIATLMSDGWIAAAV